VAKAQEMGDKTLMAEEQADKESAQKVNCQAAGVSTPIFVAGPASGTLETNPVAIPQDATADIAGFLSADALTVKFVSPVDSTFECIDGREGSPLPATAGGDLAEFSGALFVYMQQTQTLITVDNIKGIFADYMEKIITPDRPFYLHTDEHAVEAIITAVGAAGVNVDGLTDLPEVRPADPNEAAIWLQQMTLPANQGCGHMKMMLQNAAANYGLPDATIPQTLINEYFNYWWGTEEGSPERQKILFDVLQGGHTETAIISVTTDGGCANGINDALQPVPTFTHHHPGGTSVFILNPDAANGLRDSLADFFQWEAVENEKTLDRVTYLSSLNSLQSQQLTATVGFLATSKAVNTFSAVIQTVYTR